jgi:hypothetical protein
MPSLEAKASTATTEGRVSNIDHERDKRKLTQHTRVGHGVEAGVTASLIGRGLVGSTTDETPATSSVKPYSLAGAKISRPEKTEEGEVIMTYVWPSTAFSMFLNSSPKPILIDVLKSVVVVVWSVAFCCSGK